MYEACSDWPMTQIAGQTLPTLKSNSCSVMRDMWGKRSFQHSMVSRKVEKLGWDSFAHVKFHLKTGTVPCLGCE